MNYEEKNKHPIMIGAIIAATFFAVVALGRTGELQDRLTALEQMMLAI